MRSFGCACFPYIRSYNANKLSFRTIPCIFLGYGRNHKCYKCYDSVSKRIYMSRHVVFDASVYPFGANLQTIHLNSTQPKDRILLGNFTPSIVPTLPSARLQPTINTSTTQNGSVEHTFACPSTDVSSVPTTTQLFTMQGPSPSQTSGGRRANGHNIDIFAAGLQCKK